VPWNNHTDMSVFIRDLQSLQVFTNISLMANFLPVSFCISDHLWLKNTVRYPVLTNWVWRKRWKWQFLKTNGVISTYLKTCPICSVTIHNLPKTLYILWKIKSSTFSTIQQTYDLYVMENYRCTSMIHLFFRHKLQTTHFYSYLSLFCNIFQIIFNSFRDEHNIHFILKLFSTAGEIL